MKEIPPKHDKMIETIASTISENLFNTLSNQEIREYEDGIKRLKNFLPPKPGLERERIELLDRFLEDLAEIKRVRGMELS